MMPYAQDIIGLHALDRDPLNKSNKFSAEVRERAVRMVQEHPGEYPSQWAAIESIAPKIGCTSQALLGWVKREEVDSGEREGVTTPGR
jgi:transposase